MTTMKCFYLVAFVVTFPAVTQGAKRECCLCADCGPVAPEKVDLFTVSPFRDQPESVTCEDIALELLEYDDDSEMCAAVSMDLHEACCTEHFDEIDVQYENEEEEIGWLQSYLTGARALWTASSSRYGSSNRNSYNRNRYNNNGNGGYQRPASNGVRYNTQGGNFPCRMCQGRNVLQFQQMVMRDPSAGRTISASCPNLIANFARGMYSNNMCNIAKINAHRMCCPSGTSGSDPRVTGNLSRSWNARSGGRW